MNVSTPRRLTPEVSVAPHSHGKTDVAKPYHYLEFLLGSSSLLPKAPTDSRWKDSTAGREESKSEVSSLGVLFEMTKAAGTLRKWQKRLPSSCAEVSFLSPASPRRGFVCVGLGACVHVHLPAVRLKPTQPRRRNGLLLHGWVCV